MCSISVCFLFVSLSLIVVIVVVVLCVGVMLAYVTDEGYSLLLDEVQQHSKLYNQKVNRHQGNKPQQQQQDTASPNPPITADGGGGSPSHSMLMLKKWSLTALYVLRICLPESLADQFFMKIQARFPGCRLHLECIKLKKLARTKRQFTYMLQKNLKGVPIIPQESEIESYLDIKEGMGETWPFMWEVSDVKSEKIRCAGYECIPMSSYRYM